VSANNILIKKDDGNKTNECVTTIKWQLMKEINAYDKKLK